MNKPAKIALLSLAVVVGIPTLGLIATTTVNAIATASENAELRPYGQLVPVDGKNMNVVVSEDAPDESETIVVLPGLGTASPALDFAPLVRELDDDFRVVVVEPFGYGLSDQTDAPRTSAAIAGEVHEALQTLGIDRYVLAGHSIAGIYGLEYLSRFRDEVTAFVGIDTSVPGQPGSEESAPLEGMDALKQLGILRLLASFTPGAYDGLADYDDDARRQLAILSNRNTMTPTLIDEATRTPENFAAARSQTFPRDLPVLVFVVGTDPEIPGWVKLHEAQLTQVDHGELVPLDGGHYLHHTKSAEIAAKTREFLGR
ncbi:alpha/beta fold hydrolase [Herbiconiux ginsengi]|uniref:Pimeloyl-ACP methyl ester carboxylesterase n=1 Tax=Herbiconiux ginsengi TaxID=381665 RepID=A0A1H3QQQ5_9MICO|nr:alpha/beta hydrolase [Herbiconiux ginsengi]SDZ15727.1 Pimeloyl-ACP methyl ester carboxylesterase [Herbiconiux ginsengi]